MPNIVNDEKSLETTQFQGFSYGRGIRIRILDSQCEWGIRIVLFAKNSPLGCFFYAQTLWVLILRTKRKIKTDTLRHPFLFLAGAEGFEPSARGFGDQCTPLTNGSIEPFLRTLDLHLTCILFLKYP